MKKFLSMVCAVALAALCAVPAFAEATPVRLLTRLPQVLLPKTHLQKKVQALRRPLLITTPPTPPCL